MRARVTISVFLLAVTFTVNANGQNFDLWDNMSNTFFGLYPNIYEDEANAYRLKSVNQYWLYTRKNPERGNQLHIKAERSVKYSYLDFSKVTVFLVHGWYGYYTDDLNTNITRALLQSADVNVICIDWSEYSKSNYFFSSHSVPKIGTDLGDFIIWLNSMGLDYDKVHLAGHSLGSHIVGYAGRRTGGRVRRITGMDPAGPTWNNRKRLCETDAQYVECIHTCAKVFGSTKTCGHSDFYPNGGTFMPGCGIDMICSHFRGFLYFSASILYPNSLVGYKCKSVDDAMNSNCYGDTAVMGNGGVDKDVCGIYLVKTTDVYPYF